MGKGLNKLYIYHGTDMLSAEAILTNGIDFKKCLKATDNGRGFYTTQSFEFAKNRAISVCGSRSLSSDKIYYPAVIRIELSDDYQEQEYSIKTFKGTDSEWKYFVIANRLGPRKVKNLRDVFDTYNNNLLSQYDIVLDETADSGVASIINTIKFSKIPNERIIELIESIDVGQADYWSTQISFHTQRSLNCLKNFEIIKI